MRKISAILFATSALITTGQAFADAPGMNDPFFWVGGNPGSPEQSEMTGSSDSEDAGMQRDRMVADQSGNSEAAPASNPILEDYPADEAPQSGRTLSGEASMADDGCAYPKQAPATMQFDMPSRTTGERGTTPYDARRGEMAGDDGVLTAIQDQPCADIMRRGGETANSAKGNVREGDIRRANTLEDRRIPTHTVGRYSPEGSGLWHRDPEDPFIDAANEWYVRRGETLSQMLHRWADDAGFTVVYQSDVDYVIQADVILHGTFAEAAGQVIESFSNATPPISADFYLGNKVIVIDSSSDFDGR